MRQWVIVARVQGQPTGRAMWQMIGVLAELERSLIVERTQAGMKEARRHEVKFGRRKKLSPAQVAKARKLIDQGGTGWRCGRTLECGQDDFVSRFGGLSLNYVIENKGTCALICLGTRTELS